MRKIQKFKIQVRPREVARALRAMPELQPLPVDLGDRLPAFLDVQHAGLRPAAVYETCLPDQLPAGLCLELDAEAVAVSTVIATIGQVVAEDQRVIRGDLFPEGALAQSVAAVFRHQAVDHAIAFIARLLTEDAAREECTLSDRRPVEPSAVSELVSRLGADRIGVRWVGDETQEREGALAAFAGRLVPPDTRAVWIPWLPHRQGRFVKRRGG